MCKVGRFCHDPVEKQKGRKIDTYEAAKEGSQDHLETRQVPPRKMLTPARKTSILLFCLLMVLSCLFCGED